MKKMLCFNQRGTICSLVSANTGLLVSFYCYQPKLKLMFKFSWCYLVMFIFIVKHAQYYIKYNRLVPNIMYILLGTVSGHKPHLGTKWKTEYLLLYELVYFRLPHKEV